MGTPLDQQTVTRLAFSQRLLDKAQREIAAAEPYSSEALLTLHDACELLLVLAAEHLSVDLPKNVQFEDYWGQIKSKADLQLPSQTALRRVNKARVQLKHHFVLPARGDLERFLAQTRQFFEDATPMVFGIELVDVSLIVLIRERNARRWLEKALETSTGSSYSGMTTAGLELRTRVRAEDRWLGSPVP